MLEDPYAKEFQTCYDCLSQDYYWTPPVRFPVESKEVVQTVNQYNLFWKPEKVKLLLLDGSRAFTKLSDWQCILNKDLLMEIVKNLDRSLPLDEYPVNFVRSMYCLGYGESSLFDSPPAKNAGDGRFWRLLSACIDPFPKPSHNGLVSCYLKRWEHNFRKRIENKIKLFIQFKERGIWLLDASITALSIPGVPKPQKKTVFKMGVADCWDNYLQFVIDKEAPSCIVLIGRELFDFMKMYCFDDIDYDGKLTWIQPLPISYRQVFNIVPNLHWQMSSISNRYTATKE